MKIQLTIVRENFDLKVLSKKIRIYTFKDGATKDDVLEWFEDQYRDDSPIDKNYDGSYVRVKVTDTGYTNYILRFI